MKNTWKEITKRILSVTPIAAFVGITLLANTVRAAGELEAISAPITRAATAVQYIGAGICGLVLGIIGISWMVSGENPIARGKAKEWLGSVLFGAFILAGSASLASYLLTPAL